MAPETGRREFLETAALAALTIGTKEGRETATAAGEIALGILKRIFAARDAHAGKPPKEYEVSKFTIAPTGEDLKTMGHDSVHEWLEARYAELREAFNKGRIWEPAVATSVRTSAIVENTPQDLIEPTAPLTVGEELLVAFSVAVPHEKNEPVQVTWEHDGKPYDGPGARTSRAYATQPAYRYRLDARANPPHPGTWTMVVNMGGKAIYRQNFKVNPKSTTTPTTSQERPAPIVVD